jgi:oligopeptide transport system substrate-binding protein
MKSIKILSLLMALIMLVGVFAACTTDPVEDNKPTDKATDNNNKPTDHNGNTTDPEEGFVADGKDYTYKTATTALGTNWNPHTWDTNGDQSMLSYVSSPFVDMSILDSENGVYQWVYEMATSVTDVTKDNQADLSKYPVDLPEGKTAADITEGYVFEIKLNPEAAWQDGKKITADDYIESFKRLLDPSMKNYRANLYYDGESAVAGGYEYYYSKDEGIYPSVYTKYATIDAALAAGETVYLDMHNFWGLAGAKDEAGNECPQWVSIADTVKYQDPADGSWVSAADIYGAYAAYLANGQGYESCVSVYVVNETFGAGWDVVGLYKVDEYTIRYVNDTYIGFNYFLTSLTSTWLVDCELYDSLKDTSGELVTTTYGTSLETTKSYGVYKMQSLEKGKQVVYVRNENWYGWKTDKNGNLYSFTNFLVDGEKRQQYKTTKVVIDVMDEAAMKQAFLKGDLSDWSPSADELSTYSLSDQLYKVDETYTMSFFFNTNLEHLKEMDNSKGNTNSVVLSNETFRKAFSLAIDRAEFVTATQAYKPAFSLMNSLYYYDIYDDDKEDGVDGPNTNYRLTEEAMQAIVNLYGVKYGEGTPYATLKDAHDSITGYNLTEAKALMATALEELVAAGLYTQGAEIKIKIGWAKGALTSDDNKQLELMNKYINSAATEAGFGKITLEAVGNIDNRYDAVPAGEYAIGYGAWGGAAFYPFRNFQVYMDPDQYSINEAANYDPKTDKVTLTVDGKEVTMTWQAWSQSMMGTGAYATAPTSTKLAITAQLEEAFLKTYYRIPLCATTICSMLSFQCQYYTEEYNIMYGFGGDRLLDYKLDDAAWAAWVAENAVNGEIDYQ